MSDSPQSQSTEMELQLSEPTTKRQRVDSDRSSSHRSSDARVRVPAACASGLAQLTQELGFRSNGEAIHWLLEQTRPELVAPLPVSSKKPSKLNSDDVSVHNSVAFAYPEDGVDGKISDLLPVSNGGDDFALEEDERGRVGPRPTVRATVVQAGTVLYDTTATLDKAERLIAGAAAYGSQLVVFPEAFIGGYPRFISDGTHSVEENEEFKKYHAAAVDVPVMTQPGTIPSQPPVSESAPTLGQAHTRWTDDMDTVLNEVLVEEVALRGKKPNNNGLKSISINRAAEVVSERCKVVVTAENVRNRFKLMKRKYVWARAAINQSGLGVVWDGEKKYLDVEESVWKEYCKERPSKVEGLRRKFFPLYDAMWTIFGDDSGARGDGVFNTIDLEATQNPPPESSIGARDEDPVETMENQAERQAPKKKPKKDPITMALEAEAVSFDRVVVSLERLSNDIAQSNTATSFAERLWAALGNIEGLTVDQRLTANMLLTTNPHAIAGFLATPDEHKKRAVDILLRHHKLD